MGVRSVAGTVAVTLVGAVALGAMAAAVFLWSGIYNVGATEPQHASAAVAAERGRIMLDIVREHLSHHARERA